MNRRGFLGSVIGSVLGTPFLGRLESEEWQRVVLPYRMLFRDSITNFTIQAPGVARIERIDALRGTGFKFISEPLLASQAMTIDRVILLTEQGRVIRETAFDRSMHLTNGEVLFCTQELASLSIPGGATPEEFVNACMANTAKFPRLSMYHSRQVSA